MTNMIEFQTRHVKMKHWQMKIYYDNQVMNVCDQGLDI